jgi:hypothetical protein
MTEEALHRPWNVKAIVALVLGLTAPVTFGATSLPALALGYAALREINRSDGRQRGRRAAAAALVLGVAGVILLALGLVIVVMTRVRVTMEETACRNNLRRIGLGLTVYHDQNNHFPSGTIVVDGLPPEKRLSWLAALLPYLEPGRREGPQMYEKLDPQKPWDAPGNAAAVGTWTPWFLCPARIPSRQPGDPGQTSYLGIAGLGADAATVPKAHDRAGFFGYDRVITLDDVTRGTSTTMTNAESATSTGPWAAGGPATVRPVVPEDQPYIGPGRPFGGLHAGGVVVLFADARVQFIRDTVNPQVWEAHSRIHGEP